MKKLLFSAALFVRRFFVNSQIAEGSPVQDFTAPVQFFTSYILSTIFQRERM